MDLTNAIITQHATSQMAKRGLAEAEVRHALAEPDESYQVREGRIVVHRMGNKGLLRIFVDIDRNPPEVVTAYRTTRIGRYRSRP